MNVSVVGCGTVGTTVSACLADLGHEVTAIGTDAATVDRLNAGETPIQEPGLDPLVSAYAGGRLRATTEYAAAVDTDLTILAVETPSLPDGSIDSAELVAAARAVGEALAKTDGYHLIVVKSAVLPGTLDDLIGAIGTASGKTDGVEFSVAVNPEFQRSGRAVRDFMEPDRIVIGTDGDERGLDLLAELYQPLVSDWEIPVVEVGRREAMAVRYVSSAILAAKRSLRGEITDLCVALDADARTVADAVGLEDGIGETFLDAGPEADDDRLLTDVAALLSEAGSDGGGFRAIEAATESGGPAER